MPNPSQVSNDSREVKVSSLKSFQTSLSPKCLRQVRVRTEDIFSGFETFLKQVQVKHRVIWNKSRSSSESFKTSPSHVSNYLRQAHLSYWVIVSSIRSVKSESSLKSSETSPRQIWTWFETIVRPVSSHLRSSRQVSVRPRWVNCKSVNKIFMCDYSSFIFLSSCVLHTYKSSTRNLTGQHGRAVL